MQPDRRRAGRAIRKRRRLAREAATTVDRVDWSEVFGALTEGFRRATAAIEAFAALAHAFAMAFVDAILDVDTLRDDRERNAQTFRAAHRALTTGDGGP